MTWTKEDSEKLYGIPDWSQNYFSINEKGNINVCPNPEEPENSLDLKYLADELSERGIRMPILIRFPQIVKHRIELLNQCFQNAFKDNHYSGSYRGVYPIKVNQHHQLLKHIQEYGNYLGLEAGSKPELLIVLALAKNNESLIICNGFKDEEFIETALLSLKLGKKTIIVVDRASELPLIIRVAKRLNIKPKIGFRAKLYSKGSGKWVESSGARSKFGLTPAEICDCIEELKTHDMLDCLELVHFHIGSQIKSIQAIKNSLKEGARYYADLRKMGADNLNYLDVGGGLAVDYDGTTDSDSSSNYDEQEYANDVVYSVSQVCERDNLPHPHIVTESGRSLVAHHSVLLFNVLGANKVRMEEPMVEVSPSDSPIITSLYETYNTLNSENLSEYYHDVISYKEDTLKLYTLGYMTLSDRAKAEKLIWAALTKIYDMSRGNEDYEDLRDNLKNELSDTYFCNFSVFQSAPDSWAVGHIFPVMPIHKLLQEPNRKAVIADLTCDSDGKIDTFVENYETTHTLAVHDFEEGKDEYFLGIFLLGAYQEALGDLHNLFGDTDAVDILINDGKYHIESVVEGDQVHEILSYIQYEKKDLIGRIRNASERSIREGNMTNHEARLLMQYYESGLNGYTYLE